MSTPSEFYRHAVDLNRFSNAEAKQIAIAYNRLILQAVAELQILVEDERAFDRQTRLREIIRQLRASLDNWAGESSALLAGELQGLATFEEQFIRAAAGDGARTDDRSGQSVADRSSVRPCCRNDRPN